MRCVSADIDSSGRRQRPKFFIVHPSVGVPVNSLDAQLNLDLFQDRLDDVGTQRSQAPAARSARARAADDRMSAHRRRPLISTSMEPPAARIASPSAPADPTRPLPVDRGARR